MTNKKIKKFFVCLKLVKKNQKILSCSKCLQTFHLNCIKDKYCITKNMQWKCTFCSFTFPFSSCSDKEFAELFDFGNSNLFYSAKNLNDYSKTYLHIMNSLAVLFFKVFSVFFYCFFSIFFLLFSILSGSFILFILFYFILLFRYP